MSRTVSFSLPDDMFAALAFAAAARCKSRSEYARDATTAYLLKYPPKGMLAEIVRARAQTPKNVTAESNIEPATTPE